MTKISGLYVAAEEPGGWLASAAIIFEFAAFAVGAAVFGDPGFWVIAAPMLVWLAYNLRRAWTAHHDQRVLRAQELAGGADFTPLRTRRQLQALRRHEREQRKDKQLTREAERLLKSQEPAQ